MLSRERRTERKLGRLTSRTPWHGRVELFRSRTPIMARARNVSSGGIFIETRERLAEGSYVTVRVGLPGLQPFVAMCRVTRVTTGRNPLIPAGVGLRFLDVDPARNSRIDAFVARRDERDTAQHVEQRVQQSVAA